MYVFLEPLVSGLFKPVFNLRNLPSIIQGPNDKLSVRKLVELRQSNVEIDRAFNSIGEVAVKYLADLEQPGQISSVPPVRVAVTGAAGAIGYAALFRIARCSSISFHFIFWFNMPSQVPF